MASPNKRKYTMRSKEEKEKIVQDALKHGVTYAMKTYDVADTLIYDWMHKYKKDGIQGLKSKTGTTSSPKKHNPCIRLLRKKNLTREEQLELENLKLKIEVARLKKGYLVKGVGQKKEYVTIKNLNSK